MGALRLTTRRRPSPHLTALLVTLALTCSACRPAPLGSGTEVVAERETGPFAELEVRGDVEVTIELGRDRHRVSVVVDDNLVERMRTKSNGRSLLAGFDGDVRPKVRPRLHVEAPDLVVLRCHGTVDVRVSGMRNARFQVDLREAGSATITGSTKKLKVFINGSGQAHLEGLAIEEALANVSGNGSADIGSPRHLEVELHGSGRVSYGGSPTLEPTIRDRGLLTRRP